MSVSNAQIRAARALIGWSLEQLAGASGCSVATIEHIERDAAAERFTPAETAAVVRALEAGGVEFTNGGAPGVRLKPKAAFVRPDELTSETDL